MWLNKIFTMATVALLASIYFLEVFFPMRHVEKEDVILVSPNSSYVTNLTSGINARNYNSSSNVTAPKGDEDVKPESQKPNKDCAYYVDPKTGKFCNWSHKLIPETLRRDLFTQIITREGLKLPLTLPMLKKSKILAGNEERMNNVIRKLKDGKCLTIMVFGGSVAAGHQLKKPRYHAWPPLFEEWLNAKYPCKTMEKRHVVNRTGCVGATSVGMLFERINIATKVYPADIIIFAFNVNDNFVGTPSPYFTKAQRRPSSKSFTIQWYWEIILRNFLMVRSPDPPAILSFHDDYIGRIWAGKPYFDDNAFRVDEIQGDPEFHIMKILMYYEIPTISAVTWLLPLASKEGRAKQFNRTSNPWSTSAFHSDACCHPPKWGHRVLALSLIVYFQDVIDGMDMFSNGQYIEDLTMRNPPLLRMPIRITPDEEKLFVNSTDLLNLDFTSAPKENVVLGVTNTGWKHYADNKDKDKFGIIAESAGSHISFAIPEGSQGYISVSYVQSYENFGNLNVYADVKPDVTKELCLTSFGRGDELKRTINGFLAGRYSLVMTSFLVFSLEKIPGTGTKYIHFCQLPKTERQEKGKEQNKFKIVTVRIN